MTAKLASNPWDRQTCLTNQMSYQTNFNVNQMILNINLKTLGSQNLFD